MYNIWTDADVKQFLQYKEKITAEKLGVINIGGICSKKDSRQQYSASGHVYRVYDWNIGCPQRNPVVNNPGSKRFSNGVYGGIVVLVAKDSQTGDFFRIHTPQTVSPAAGWIRRHYTGGVRAVAEQILREHEQLLHQDYCTILDSLGAQPVLTEVHLDQYIIPAILQLFKEAIQKADAKCMTL